MSIQRCRECQLQVSDQARRCPHCGAPSPGNQDWNGSGIDWKSESTLFGLPLIHVAFGRNARGRLRVAKGIIAIGQFAFGVIAIAQFGVGLLFGFGQFIFGLTAIAQVAVTLYFAIGQIAIGYIALGQVVVGTYGMGMAGFAKYLWSNARKDPEAYEYFRQLAEKIGIHLTDYIKSGF